MDKKRKTYLVHIVLFLITLVTTTVTGSAWINGRYSSNWGEIMEGLQFSVPFLLIFTFHEFGHYFTAVKNKIKTTLPFFIPFPPILPMVGTLGAIIRLKERVTSTRVNFDIGIAGPLAGFVIAFFTLWYGYTHLPEPEYVYEIHPEYKLFGENYADFVYAPDSIVTKEMYKDILSTEEMALLPDTVFRPDYFPLLKVNKSILINFFEETIVPERDQYKIPNDYEYAHYPFIFAGFWAMFFTALNLLPIGQLDGGHVVYGLFGHKWHTYIATVTYFGFLFYAGLGLITVNMPIESLMIYIPLYVWFLFACLKGTMLPVKDRWMYAVAIFAVQFLLNSFFPDLTGFSGWLLLAFMLGRVIGIQHPPSEDETPLDTTRVVLGWISLIILITCMVVEPMTIA